jgi:hypothetical protein
MSAMRVAICAGFGALAFAGQAASAQQTGFVAAPRADEYYIALLVDVGGLKRSGMDVEVRTLEARPEPLDKKQPLSAEMWTYRMSCDWNSSGVIEWGQVDADGEVPTPKKGGVVMSFVAPGSWNDRILQLVCNPEASAQAPQLASVKDALAEVARVIKRPEHALPEVRPAPPKEITGPVVIVNHPNPKKKQYGAVRIEPATGNALYLDWANIRKKDGKLQAIALELLGHRPTETPYSLMKVNSAELDCKARTVQVLGYTSWGGNFTNRRQVDKAGPVRAAAGWPLGSELLDAACKGRKPRKTFTAELDVARFVEQSRTESGR